jgi:hypothetical protein
MVNRRTKVWVMTTIALFDRKAWQKPGANGVICMAAETTIQKADIEN